MRCAVAALWLVACYSPRATPGAPCSPSGACPAGLVCAPATSTCEPPGSRDAPIVPIDATDATDASDASRDAAGDGAIADAAGDAPVTPVTLSSISPTSGIVTTSLALAGSGFGAIPGTVKIRGVTATVQSWTDQHIMAVVPDLSPGAADVVVQALAGPSGARTFTVILPPMVYVNNDVNTGGGGTVSTFTADLATGKLVAGPIAGMGTPANTYGGCSASLAVNATTRRVFATGTTAVAVFDIDPVTGALTAVPGSPFSTGGSSAFAVVANKAGTRLFVANYLSKTIAAFSIATNGALTPVTGSPFAIPLTADIIALSANDDYLFASQFGGSFIVESVASSGALAQVGGSFAGGASVVRRTGRDEIYVPAQATRTLAAWTVTAGVPTQIPGSPFAVTATGGNLETLAFTSTGNRLYLPFDNAGTVVGYDLDAAGTPTAIAGTPWTLAGITDISCIAVSAGDTYLVAVGENQGVVGVAALAAGGTPTDVTGSPFPNPATGTSASGLGITF